MTSINGHAATESAAADLTIPMLLTKSMIRKYYLPVGERTLDRWVSSGVFPSPDISIGGKARYWRRDTVEDWITEKANA